MPQVEPKTVRFNEREIKAIEQLLDKSNRALLQELAERHSGPLVHLLAENEVPSSFSEVVRLLVRVALTDLHSLRLEEQYARSAGIMKEVMNPALVASMTEVAWSAIAAKYGGHSLVSETSESVTAGG
jgi:hypothetical protein